MSFFTNISKRKRIESLVKKSIENSAWDAANGSRFAHVVASCVKGFTEVCPKKYFDMADDRKIAGLVLAYMLEVTKIGVHQVNDDGHALLKLTAEVDLDEFRENTPRTFKYLRSINMVEPSA